MTRPTATCELYVNDTRVPDTGQQLIAAEPTVLDGLSLTWGRDGQNEQPGPATCSFTILDRYAESDFLDRLHVGSPVALWAEGRVSQDSITSYIQTFDDGTFDTWSLGLPPENWTSYGTNPRFSVVVIAVAGRGRVLRLDVNQPSQSSERVVVPPRAFSPNGTLPNAWDDIPRYYYSAALPGRDWWGCEMDVRATPGVPINFGIATYANPWDNAGQITGLQTITATGDWQHVSREYKGGGEAVWLGAYVSIGGLASFRWSSQTGTWAEHPETWADQPSPYVEIDNIVVGPPAGSATIRRVLSFSGAVTDVIATPYGNGDTLNLAVTAADLGSDLGNRVIGDEPWPVQTLATRADRIAQLAGITTSPRVRIDTPLGALQVSYRDIDAQPSYALLQDLAQTGGGVLWAATHAVTGPFLWIENPADRASLRELTLSGSLITITGASDGVTIISACDLLEDPISWRQDTADVSTVVAVTWLEQGTDDDGKVTTTERTETVSDPTAVTTYGTRRLSISTELVNQADAISLANRALATARAVPWRIEGLTFDTDSTFAELDTVDDASREIALLNLLDGTTRMGLAVTLVDMPDYAPRGSISDVYVEGGRYAYEGGAWTLALNATPSGGQGTSATWGEIDAAWLWLQWSPTITWQDLYGVAA